MQNWTLLELSGGGSSVFSAVLELLRVARPRRRVRLLLGHLETGYISSRLPQPRPPNIEQTIAEAH